MAAHMSGLNQHMAVQNVRKNFDAGSPREIWMISCRRMSDSSSCVYSRMGSTMRVVRLYRPMDSGVVTASERTSFHLHFRIHARSSSISQTCSVCRSVTGTAFFKIRRRNARCDPIFQTITPTAPTAQIASST